MKKYFSIFTMILAFSLFAFALVGCGKTEEQAKPAETAEQVDQSTNDAPAEAPAEMPATADATQADTKASEGNANSAGTTGKESYAKEPIKGKVVSINKVIMGMNGVINKAEATKLLSGGQPVAFREGTDAKGKIYFILNADGSYASKKLIQFADANLVAVVGKVITGKNGYNFIIADMIEEAK